MHKMYSSLFDCIGKYPKMVIAIIIAVTVCAIGVLPHIQLDESLDAFFDRESYSYQIFQEWKKQFGSDNYAIISFSEDTIFSKQALETIRSLTEQFEAVSGVERVISLTNVNDIIGMENDFIVEPLIEKIPESTQELAMLQERVLSNKLYQKHLISSDARTCALLVELADDDQVKETNEKKRSIGKILTILKDTFGEEKAYYVSGGAVIEYFFVQYMKNDLKHFMPLMIIIVTIILLLVVRSFKGIIYSLAVVVISLTWTMAFLYLCRFSINNVTTVIPPIIIAVSIASSIHLTVEYFNDKARLGGGKEVIKKTIMGLFSPCLFTALTTIVGFLSLTVSRVPAIKELGCVVAVGVFISFFLSFIFLPAMLILLDPFLHVSPKPREKGKAQYLVGLGEFNARYKFLILTVTVVIIIFAIVGLKKIKTETSVLEYFKKNSFLYKSTEFIEEHLSGIHFLNVSLKAETVDYFQDPHILSLIDTLQQYAENIPSVDVSLSVVDYLKEINKAFHAENDHFYTVPQSKELVSQYVLLYGGDDLDDFVDLNWKWTTVRIRVHEHATSKLKQTIQTLREYVSAHFPENVQCDIVGGTVLEVEANETVTKGQIESLGLAMLTVFGMMFLIFRSVSAGLVSMFPNVLPILVNFGIMGWCGVYLDSATSMISAIGIGIIVDDTIHFIHNFGEQIKSRGNYLDAMYATLFIKGKPIIFTSVILFFGFGIVMLSEFSPSFYFGLLSALLMCNALWADLVVLPAFLITVKPRFHKIG